MKEIKLWKKYKDWIEEKNKPIAKMEAQQLDEWMKQDKEKQRKYEAEEKKYEAHIKMLEEDLTKLENKKIKRWNFIGKTANEDAIKNTKRIINNQETWERPRHLMSLPIVFPDNLYKKPSYEGFMDWLVENKL